jgi:hypothetical protein
MSFAASLSAMLLAGVFVVAAIAKLLDRAGTRETLVGFGVPARAAAPGAVALPLLELAIAVALIPSATAVWGAVAGLATLLVFTAAIAVTLARGAAPDCNCFGGLSRTAVGRGTLVRNAVLAAVAAFAAAAGTDGAIAWIRDAVADDRGWVVAIVALTSIVLGLAWFCWQLLRQNGRLLLRLDAQTAELAAGETYAPGLEVGEPAPAFARDGIDGRPLSLEALLAPGLPVALVFTDPDCGACREPLELAARVQRGDALTVAIVARGDAERLGERTRELGLERVVHDADDSLFGAYRFGGSPAAVLIGADGRVASAPVLGGPEVTELLRGTEAPPELTVRSYS